MRFQLLGPLSITDGRGVVVLPPSKPTSLLAALLVRPGEVVPAHRLREAVWGEDQPATAKAALQSCVLRLRRLFAKYDVEEQAVVAVAGGYRVPADGDTLDLLHFRRLADRAASAGEAELPLLREALGLWRGPLLANVPSELLHRDEVPRLVEERLRVLERVCEIQLARGRGREVLVDLWEATRTHPQHEGFAAQLMRALYRVGRQIEALAEYRRIRTRLREELGVDPGAELQSLELAILRGDEPGGPALPATLTRAPHPSPAAPGPAPRAAAARAAIREPSDALPSGGGPPAPGGTAAAAPRLPAVPGFTGRSRETAALADLLGGAHGSRRAGTAPVLAVVSGGPGMGKTALALHTAQLVADRYPGGSVLVPLTGPDGVPRPGGEAAAALRAALPRPGHGPCLVVLDDVVHPDQVRELLDVPGCGAVVATSRMGLAALVATHAPGVLQLGALTAPESEALLTAVLGAERVGAEASAARELARTCGHVPLALRIAAARLLTRPKLRLADYAAWLDRDLPARLALPDDPRMSVPLALDEALGRLPAPLAEAQLRLARCEGRITAVAAGSALSLAETDAEELLERLLDTGLLEEEQPGAFLMNPLFRAHALRRADRTAAGLSRSSAAARRALPSPAP
ncbi:winged helix-turn-helix domain-containing protein [Streptomyces sp. C10-9-1]|uniref:BTAD domain-containing putative transcriptional regulator n=1 Tax=Streptomyces sp. C10-9-1 TaxID=1859285 RepID=UPI002111945F|nr:BTAD domain-containing putative transcriptional regulator [Streptomyces sp. C10-9-1]MCQ6554916.1 winged helix-turn-helix domain-containing protein [Streptomyces sp. C10-9-1]